MADETLHDSDPLASSQIEGDPSRPAAPEPSARTADEAFERCRGVLDSAGINDNMRREVVKRLDDHVNGRG